MSDASSRGVGFGAIERGAGGRYPSAECKSFVLQWIRHFSITICTSLQSGLGQQETKCNRQAIVILP